jgi:predicted TIM-barrel fold metal-dependent hydrolase
MHIFGPGATYPYDPGRSYTPPDALSDAYRRMADTLGIERTVVVQPSVYGTDNACTRDAVAALGARGRGVAVFGPDISEVELQALHDVGFRGVRINLVSSVVVSTEGLEALAGRLAPLGWHIQLFIDHTVLVDIETRLAALPVDLVLDHHASLDIHAGFEQPAYQALRRLLDRGGTWVKLSGAYRIDPGRARWTGAAPFSRVLIQAAPERLVWGTDWPHPSLFEGDLMPDEGDQLDALMNWAEDEATLRRILVDNPAELYDFEPVG